MEEGKMTTKQCSTCGARVEGLCAQDAWGLLKQHNREEHGLVWDPAAREWTEATAA